MHEKLSQWFAAARQLPGQVWSRMMAAFAPERRRRTIQRLILAALIVALLSAVLWLLGRPTGQRHYLLLGRDGWGNAQDVGRTDAMAIITLDFSGHRVLFTSLLRDTRVTLPSGSKNRLNTLAQYYGDDALAQYIEETYGIKLSGRISANFSSMVGILDAAGGITVDLTAGEVRYVRETAGDYPPDFVLREGPCVLNGAQALRYMRCRELDDDGGRTRRQAKVVQALMERAKQVSLGQALAVIRQVSGSYATDLALGEQLTLLRDAYRLRRAPLVRHQIPAEGTFKYVSGSMLEPDMARNQALFQALLAGAVESAPR